MPEPFRQDMLPDPENTSGFEEKYQEKTDVAVVEPQEPIQKVEPAPVTATETPKDEPVAPLKDSPPKGFVPYQALDEERRKRKEAEAKLKEKESLPSVNIPEDEMSDEGRALKSELDSVKKKLAEREQADAMASVIGQYPAISDKLDEFDEFRETRPNLTLEEAADVFVVKNGLNEPKTTRKGLEKPTAGPKTQVKEGIDAKDVERIMFDKDNSLDEKKLQKMINSGQLDPDKIRY